MFLFLFLFLRNYSFLLHHFRAATPDVSVSNEHFNTGETNFILRDKELIGSNIMGQSAAWDMLENLNEFYKEIGCKTIPLVTYMGRKALIRVEIE